MYKHENIPYGTHAVWGPEATHLLSLLSADCIARAVV